MSDYKDRLSAVRFNPMLMQNVALDELESQVGGSGVYDVPDASNPFVFLLEASTLNTSMGISEGEAMLRRLYPSMALTTDELYLHMSDDDYLGRFATPAWTTFEMYISKDELLQRALPVGEQGVKQLVIPRLTEFMVAETKFTLQYPIEIRIMTHGGIQVVYNTDSLSPIQTLDSNMVDWMPLKVDNQDLLLLRIPCGQFEVKTFTETLNSAVGFDVDYAFNDQFYFARVFLSDGVKTDGSTKWREIRTTHTDQVYDYQQQTAVLQLNGNLLNVHIPLIYFSLGNLNGEVRVDIYSTKGKLEMDPGSYTAGQFSYTLNDIDDNRTYVSPLQNFTRLSVMNPNQISGGSDSISFEELRTRVMSNSLGDSQIPITGAQLETQLESRGYNVVTNIDNITNRQFLASRRIDPPKDGSVTSGMGSVMAQLQSTMNLLALSSAARDNGERITLTPAMLYEYVDGVVRPVLSSDVTALKALAPDSVVRAVNNKRYMFSPLHYVLDTTRNAFDVRPYYMDQPSVVRKVFVDENNTALYEVSVSDYLLTRIEGGYRFRLKLKSGDSFKALDDEHAIVQMGYRPVGENSYASINGTLVGIDEADGERVYQFDLLTNFDVDHKDGLYTTNWSMFDTIQNDFACLLEDDFDISFIVGDQVNFGYLPGSMDGQVQRHLLPTNFMVVGRERLRVQLGYSLNNLWRRNRSLISSSSYRYWDHSVPWEYEETIYRRDSNGQVIITIVDDELVYEIEHAKGDPVLDDEGQPVMRYLKGDVMLDEQGNPILVEPRKILREFTLFLVDGTYYFVTDEQAKAYRDAVPMQIVKWILNDVDLIERRLLEKSELYLYPTATIGDTTAVVKEALQSTVALDQTFSVSYYMTDSAFSNASLREALLKTTKSIVNEMLGLTTVSVSDIITRLKANAGDDVISIEAGGLGGQANNFSVISILDTAVRMSLRKRLTVLSNQLLAVQDDIEVNFLRHTIAK